MLLEVEEARRLLGECAPEDDITLMEIVDLWSAYLKSLTESTGDLEMEPDATAVEVLSELMTEDRDEKAQD